MAPNPATNEVKLSMQQPDTYNNVINIPNGTKQVRIIDKAGRTVKTHEFSGGSPSTTINVGGLKPDIYILQISDGKNTSSSTIMIKR